MKEKLKRLISELNQGLVEREGIIKLSLLSLLAQENIILVGPPGTAKSEVSRRLAKVIHEPEYFEYLLTKFTTPEEIFGPLSISELKENRFKRNTDGYMPVAEVTFLDEIFKANSSILNSLLTIINEKTYHNGMIKEKVPLLSLIGASNELPIGDTELNALYDRFLVRVVVDYVQDHSIDDFFNLSDEEIEIAKDIKMSVDEIREVRTKARNVRIPDEIQGAIKEIRMSHKNEFKENSDESISDRKFIKMLNLLKVSAFTNNRESVDYSDLVLLKDCLWNNDQNREKARKLVVGIVKKNMANAESGSLVSISENKEAKKSYENGSGTESNPILIKDAADLFHLCEEDNQSSGHYYEQVADIDLGEITNWTPIKSFSDHYNGNGYKIMNLKIDRAEENVGLFGVIEEGAVVRNIIFEEAEVKGSEKNVGIVCGLCKGKIENVTVGGKVESNENAGGVAGYNYGIIVDCVSSTEVSSSSSYSEGMRRLLSYSSYSGGIVGYSEGGSIESCYSTGSISSSYYYSYSGGMVGYSKGGSIESCYSTGSISSSSSDSDSRGILGLVSSSSSDYSYSGGMVGYSEGGSIESCYSTGSISSSSSDSSSYSGGMVGYSEGGSIESCICLCRVIEGGEINRIADFNSSKAINNHAIAINGISSSDSNSSDGKDFPKALLSQRFFESTLSWDFENIWTWDNEEKLPVLIFNEEEKESYGNNETEKVSNEEVKNQLDDNIWL